MGDTYMENADEYVVFVKYWKNGKVVEKDKYIPFDNMGRRNDDALDAQDHEINDFITGAYLETDNTVHVTIHKTTRQLRIADK